MQSSSKNQQQVGKQACDIGSCTLRGHLDVKRNIAMFLDKEEQKDSGLDVLVLKDDVQHEQSSNIYNQTCDQMKNIQHDSVLVLDKNTTPTTTLDFVKFDGSYFVHSRTNNSNPRYYQIYVLDCKKLLMEFGQPKVQQEFDFIQELPDFVTSNLPNGSVEFLDGQTHFGKDQVQLPGLFFISFIVFLALSINQFRNLFKKSTDGIKWHFLWVNISCLLICCQCFFNFIHLMYYKYDGVGLVFLDFFGNLLEIFSDIIITTLLLCMATGYLTKQGSEIELDLVIPLAIFAALFNLLIFAIDYVTDTDFKFFAFDSWVGYIISIIKILMQIIFHFVQNSTFQKTMNESGMLTNYQQFLNQLQQYGSIHFLQWPFSFIFVQLIINNSQPQQSLIWWHFLRVGLNFATIYIFNQTFTVSNKYKDIVEGNKVSLGNFE